MIETLTSVSSSRLNLLGGEWIAVENSTNASVINLAPEFALPENNHYQGHFCVIPQTENTLAVYDTTLLGAYWQEDTATPPPQAGSVKLHWLRIAERSDESYLAIPCFRQYELPALENFAVTASGCLVLKMTRVYEGQSDYSFSDSYLGEVHLNFEWMTLPQLPQPDSRSDYLLIAGIIVDENGFIEEIIQQQCGIGNLYIPLKAGNTPEPSSSSSDSEAPDPPSTESSSSETPDPPSTESSSSETPDPPSTESSSSETPDPPSTESSSSETPDPPSTESSSTSAPGGGGGGGGTGKSSSSSPGNGLIINIVMIYEENAIYYSDEFAPMQNYTRTEVCGSFAYQPENIGKNYTVELWGTRQYGLASDAVFEDVLHLLTIMPSSQYDYWTFYDPRANEGMSFMDMVNNDTSYSTPV